MEFDQALEELAAKVQTQRSAIQTEEGTKTAFVMPFLSTVLGYDVFDPHEVVPEFVADVGVKRGEKVDYAIMRDGEVQILVECKSATGELRVEHASQLFRYFSVTNARIAVLTNGQVYNFYTDIDAPNRMDERPFLVLDLLDIDESVMPELRKLTKDSFDLESVLSAAGELKYVGALERALASQFKDPDDEFVRLLASGVYEGRLTRAVRQQFTALVAKASRQFLEKQVKDRLKTALATSYSAVAAGPSGQPEEGGPQQDVAGGFDAELQSDTTLEELEGYRIVKAIACCEVKGHRLAFRDAKTYFSILLDDNNRKTIARLWFNGKRQKYIGLFDENKDEARHPIDTIEQVYEYADIIRTTVRTLDGNPSQPQRP